MASKTKVAAVLDDHHPRTARMPQYRKLVEILTKEISSGKYPVRSMLPTEHELCARFKVSRFTIREALRDLADHGLISRRQGSGSIVVALEPARSLAQELWSLERLFQQSVSTQLRVMGTNAVIADATLAVLLQCRIGEEWFLIETLSRQKNKTSPIMWSDVYVKPKYAGIAPSVGKSGKLIYALLEEEFGITVTHVDIELLSGVVSTEKAKALGVKPGTPSLIIVRRYQTADGEAVQISVSEHPAGRYNFSINLQRRRGGRKSRAASLSH